MKPFSDVSSVIKTIIDSFSSTFNLGVYTEIDDNLLFLDKLKFYFGDNISFYSGFLKESFPQLNITNFSLKDKNNAFRQITAGGCSWNKEISLIKGKGEFLERISSLFPLEEAVGNGFDGIYFAKYPNKKLLVKRLLGFGYSSVSYSDVFFGIRIAGGIEKKPKRQITSNGGAGHFVYNKAVVSGWLELIQRDAFLMYWLNTISPKKIDIDGYINKSALMKKTLASLKRYNLEYYFLDFTSDIEVPVCGCVLVTASPTGKRVYLGLSSGFDIDSLIQSSFGEACAVMHYNYTAEPFILNDNYVPFKDKNIDMQERINIYTNNVSFEKFKFLISSRDKISVDNFITINGKISAEGEPASGWKVTDKDNENEQLEYLKKVFKEKYKKNKNYDVSVYEIKNPLLSYFDYKVVRVMCDALYYLYLNESFGDKDHPRLKEFVSNKKLESIAKLNIWPHPFP